MPETIEPRKGATGQPIAQPSPVEMLKQAVAGGPKAAAKATPPAAAPTRKAFHLGANGRLAAASVAALVGGVCLGLVAASQERSGGALAQVQAELSAGRSEAARFAQEIDRARSSTHRARHHDLDRAYRAVARAATSDLHLDRVFDVTLAADPDVKLLFNHRDMPMARTRAGNLALSVTPDGLTMRAEPIDLPLTRDIVAAVEAGLLDEMSFAFRIVRGSWSPDYTEYRIAEIDLERGDVAVVTYGANPFTELAVERAPAPVDQRARRSRLAVAARALDLRP